MSNHLPRALLCILALLAALAAGSARAGTPGEMSVIIIDDGRVYRKVEGDPVTGKDVIDFIVEENWDKFLQIFIEHVLRVDEARDNDVHVTDAEVDAELQFLLTEYAKAQHLDPAQIKLEDILKQRGTAGAVSSFRSNTRDNLLLLGVFKKLKQAPGDAHTIDKSFQQLAPQLLEKRMTERGVLTDEKKLGPGEAVRIGTRGYARDEVRQFMLDSIRQIEVEDFKVKLDILAHERIVKKTLLEKNIRLAADDDEFHFSYLCRRRERQTGGHGKIELAEELRRLDPPLTIAQYVKTRLYKYDAAISRLARDTIGVKGEGARRMKAEFNAHPERYQRADKLIAHLFIRVLDPDGRPYTSAWKSPDHGAINAFVARKREEQFEQAKPKIEGLVALLKEDWDGAVKKYSDHKDSAVVGGRIGRVNPKTILPPPCGVEVRDAALKLSPGEISTPVRSDYGWHILKCLEKQEVTYEEAEMDIYINLLHEERVRIDDELRKRLQP
jgi:hypothetical protein